MNRPLRRRGLLADEPVNAPETTAATTPLSLPGEERSAAGGLAKQTRSGLVLSGGSRLYGQILQFGSSIVLARLLSPRDFGLVATVYVFAGVASLLAEMGLGSALVRKRTLSKADLGTAFWMNAFVGVMLTLVVGALGPLLALWYDAPALAGLMWLVAVRFSLSLYVVPLALLERSMSFGRIARIDVTAFTLGAAAAMVAAFSGLGYYSLIVSPLVQSAVQTVLFFATTRFVPRTFIRRESAQELWSYTSRYAGANLLNYVRLNADGFIVGKYIGQAELGFYGRAMVLISLPMQQITDVLHRVMLPTFTRLRDDPARLFWAYSASLGAIGVVVGTGMAILAASAEVLVPFLWGDQWIPAVPLVGWLAAAGVTHALSVPTGWLCEVEGRTSLLMKLAIVKFVITVGGLLLGVQYGVVGVAAGLALSGLVNLVPSLVVAVRLLDVSMSAVLRSIGPAVAAAAAAGGVAELVGGAAAALPAVAVLGLQGILGGLAALVCAPIADRVLRTGLLEACGVLLGRKSA